MDDVVTNLAARWKGIALLGIMIIPFLMGIFLFEKLTGNILESGLEKARDILPIYAKRMEEAGKPASFLSSAISREIHGRRTAGGRHAGLARPRW